MIKAGPLPGNAKSSGNAKSAAAITVTKRGRPKTGKAMTGAEMAAEFDRIAKKAGIIH